MQAAEVCRSIDQAMAAANITRHTARAVPAGRFSPFRISPEPFWITAVEAELITAYGGWLRDFYHAADRLYRLSLEGSAPGFVAAHLDAGKPEWLLRVAQAESFRDQIPVIIRPDLLFTQAGIRATELDSVPGSMGLLSFLEQTYTDLGHRLLPGQSTQAAFLHALNSLPGGDGLTAIIVSEECSGYRLETSWLAARWQERDPSAPLVVSPEELNYDERGVWLAGQRVTRVYRFFELFDWENVAGAHALLHLAAAGKVTLTPPPKPHLEEKMWFAFLHHPELQPVWQSLLGPDVLTGLRQLFPPTWLVSADPAASRSGPLASWPRLQQGSRKERPYILKPSGFSPLAWGGHGFSRGKDYTTKAWAETIQSLLAAKNSPSILQEYQHSLPRETEYCEPHTGRLQSFSGKTRLCPYYFLAQTPKQPGQESVQVSGALATTVPISKPVIHGMTEAVMAPTGVR